MGPRPAISIAVVEDIQGEGLQWWTDKKGHIIVRR